MVGEEEAGSRRVVVGEGSRREEGPSLLGRREPYAFVWEATLGPWVPFAFAWEGPL